MMMTTLPAFRRGIGEAPKPPRGSWEMNKATMADMALLDDHEREALCLEVLSEFGAEVVSVTDKGEMIHSCCLPFGHQDSSPSASLNYKNLMYLCFGCGGGSILWLIGLCRGVGTDEARRWLRKTTKVDEGRNLGDMMRFFDSVFSPDEGRDTPIPRMSDSILTPWAYIHPYMTEVRGVPEETVVGFGVGWDPKRDRIVIPHWWDGTLVGWQTRRLRDDGTPKYENSPDFPRDKTIYNYRATETPAIIVESALSVLSKSHLGLHIEATFGASVSDRQSSLLGRHERVILWFDNDAPGWKATERVGDALMGMCDVWAVESPWAADPADLDDGNFVSLVSKAIPYALWTPPTTLHPWEA